MFVSPLELIAIIFIIAPSSNVYVPKPAIVTSSSEVPVKVNSVVPSGTLRIYLFFKLSNDGSKVPILLCKLYSKGSFPSRVTFNVYTLVLPVTDVTIML